MIIKFNLYLERKNDLRRSDEVNIISKEILNLIKKHFLKCIKAKLLDCEIDEFMYNGVEINLEERENISFSEEHVPEKHIDGTKKYKYHLFIGLDSLTTIIKKIEKLVHSDKNLDFYYKELDNLDFYDLLENDEKIFLKHEITHMKDFQELYDIFYIGLRKSVKKNLTKQELVDIYKSDKKKYIKRYIDNYYNDNTEYNAVFLSSLSQITEELLEQPELLNDFTKFKKKFISYLNIGPEYYDRSDLRKKINNRIYDAFINLKKKI